MAYVVIEWDFPKLLGSEESARREAALAPCLELRNIKKLRTVLAEDGHRAYCEFEAPDAETLREAYRAANLELGRVWAAKLFDIRQPSTQ